MINIVSGCFKVWYLRYLEEMTYFAAKPQIEAAKMLELRRVAMDETRIEGQLNELVKQFGGMADPGYSKLTVIAKESCSCQKQLRKGGDSLQELLDYLRICIKYQHFDLEATRRENKYLRKLLDGGESEE